MKTTISQAIKQHVASVSDEARADMVIGLWDEVMTDALYAACGATSQEEMQAAKSQAEHISKTKEF